MFTIKNLFLLRDLDLDIKFSGDLLCGMKDSRIPNKEHNYIPEEEPKTLQVKHRVPNLSHPIIYSSKVLFKAQDLRNSWSTGFYFAVNTYIF